MRVTSLDFIEIHGRYAQCLLTFDEKAVSLKCESLLPEQAEAGHHRIAWLQDALRQLRRMPEYRSAASEANFDDIVLSATSALRKQSPKTGA